MIPGTVPCTSMQENMRRLDDVNHQVVTQTRTRSQSRTLGKERRHHVSEFTDPFAQEKGIRQAKSHKLQTRLRENKSFRQPQRFNCQTSLGIWCVFCSSFPFVLSCSFLLDECPTWHPRRDHKVSNEHWETQRLLLEKSVLIMSRTFRCRRHNI